MIEVATERAGEELSPAIISEIVGMGRTLLEHPIELLPTAREGLEQIADKYRLVLITKGDLLDQERKLAESGAAVIFRRNRDCFQQEPRGL